MLLQCRTPPKCPLQPLLYGDTSRGKCTPPDPFPWPNPPPLSPQHSPAPQPGGGVLPKSPQPSVPPNHPQPKQKTHPGILGTAPPVTWVSPHPQCPPPVQCKGSPVVLVLPGCSQPKPDLWVPFVQICRRQSPRWEQPLRRHGWGGGTPSPVPPRSPPKGPGEDGAWLVKFAPSTVSFPVDVQGGGLILITVLCWD